MENHGSRSLTVFVGPMFSGKTERLISQYNRLSYSKAEVRVIKPALDTRNTEEDENFITSRRIIDGVRTVTDRIPATRIDTAAEFREYTNDRTFNALLIDEAQFMRDWIVHEVWRLLHQPREGSLHIFAAGLDTDFNGRPFGPIGGLLSMANSIEKLFAVCMQCGSHYADRSQRCGKSSEVVQIGDFADYEARCINCFTPQT